MFVPKQKHKQGRIEHPVLLSSGAQKVTEKETQVLRVYPLWKWQDTPLFISITSLSRPLLMDI